MTTIAYNHDERTIAFDSRVTSHTLICSDTENKSRFENGDFWFIAGSVKDNQILIDSFTGKVSINYELDAYGFRVDKHGNVDICQLDEKGNPTVTPVNYNYAIGSGCELAIAAMDFGRTAAQAVEYAKTRDSATGGIVRVFDIDTRQVTSNAI